jgi:hypothetical protein
MEPPVALQDSRQEGYSSSRQQIGTKGISAKIYKYRSLHSFKPASNSKPFVKKVLQTKIMSDSDFIAARQERWRVAHNSLDADKLMSLMTDDCDYSDHGHYPFPISPSLSLHLMFAGLGVAHIDGASLRALAESVFSSVSQLGFETVSVNGTKEFTAWEWTAKGTVKKEIPGVPYAVGQEFEARGCSLFWWDMESGGEKIKVLAEYSKFL